MTAGTVEINEKLITLSDEMNKSFSTFKELNDKLTASATREQELVNNLEKAKTDIMTSRQEQTKLLKRLDEIELRSQRPNLNQEEVTEEEKDKFNIAFRKLIKENNFRVLSEEERNLLYTKRAMNEAIDTQGGILAPSVFEKDILRYVYESAETRLLADVRQTTSKESQILTLGSVAVAWGDEEEQYPETQADTGSLKIPIQGLRSLVLVTDEMLEDSSIDLFSELSEAFGQAIAEAEDEAFIVGNGVKRPLGILAMSGSNLANPLNVVASGVAGGLTDNTKNGMDTFIKCQFALKNTYRKKGTWMMNSKTESTILQLKDNNGNYLWRPSNQLGSPIVLFGNLISNNEFMPDIAANAYPILFGDFKRGLKIRDRTGLTISKLVERYADTGKIGFRIKKRLGSRCAVPKAFSAVKIATSV